jgi:hypothetical protein
LPVAADVGAGVTVVAEGEIVDGRVTGIVVRLGLALVGVAVTFGVVLIVV